MIHSFRWQIFQEYYANCVDVKLLSPRANNSPGGQLGSAEGAGNVRKQLLTQEDPSPSVPPSFLPPYPPHAIYPFQSPAQSGCLSKTNTCLPDHYPNCLISGCLSTLEAKYAGN